MFGRVVNGYLIDNQSVSLHHITVRVRVRVRARVEE